MAKILQDFLYAWLLAIKKKSFILEAIITAVAMVLLLNIFDMNVAHVEERGGAVLQDPILTPINTLDFTWQTFTIIYFASLLTLIQVIQKPEYLVKCVQAFTLVLFFRMVTMYLTPLRYPDDMIPLIDPFVQFIFNSDQVWRNDLFFSGHTSSLVMMYFFVKGKWMKTILLLSCVVVGVFVILQHVHYTIDVVAAPFFAWGAWSIIKKINPEFFQAENK
jgi:hypothetical protein